MVIREASENYLETILILQQKQNEVRAVDICNHLGFAKSTVSIAMKKLRENGYISIDENAYITLTPKGSEIAEKIYERHIILGKLFMLLGVDEKIATEDACKVEHDISEETFACLKKFYLHQKEKKENY